MELMTQEEFFPREAVRAPNKDKRINVYNQHKTNCIQTGPLCRFRSHSYLDQCISEPQPMGQVFTGKNNQQTILSKLVKQC